MKDTIYRADAIEAVEAVRELLSVEAHCAITERISALPSADAVSMEEHVKELNDLASAWKNKFINAEKRTEEIYDETMAKVANECKECKERLRNLRPSAEAEPTVIRSRTLMPTKDFKEWAKRIRETNPNAVVIPCDAEVVYSEAVQIPIKLEKRYPESKDEDITDAFMRGYLAGRSSAEAVQGWIPCSERLPDVDVEVLTTTDWSDVLIAWLLKCGAWETEDSVLDYDEITAWMPLPKPYKGGEDE